MRRLVVFVLIAAACGTADTTTSNAPVSTSTPVATTTAPGSTSTVTTPATTGDGSTTAAPTTTTTEPPATTTTLTGIHSISVTYAGGEIVVEGSLEIARNDDVVITITSDVADEAHLHGYDIFADLVSGEPGAIEFVANRQGIFELELEDARLPLLEIEVR